jgi:nitroreductase
MPTPNFAPLEGHVRRPDDEMLQRAADFREEMARRRTVRRFAPDPVPMALIEECLRTAGTAPSGANMQPWHFAVVTDADRKRQIRDAAEAEEREFYAQRATPEWLAALLPLGTDDHKPYLEIAPVLIGVFVQRFSLGPDGERVPHYYATESVGLATGLLVAALHHAGLATLTHTPSPMGFLNDLMGRPPEERPFVLLVTGHPAPDAEVPTITRKPLAEIASFL